MNLNKFVNIEDKYQYRGYLKILEYFGYDCGNRWYVKKKFPLILQYISNNIIEFSERDFYESALIISYDEFRNLYQKCTWGRPKFKVGDRVKICNWDKISIRNSSYSESDFLDCHKVESLNDYPAVKLMLFPKEGKKVVYGFIHKRYLSIKESKPKCKFIKGEIVIADLHRLGWKIPEMPSEHEARIETVDSEFIYIKLLRDGDYKVHFPIIENEEYNYIKKVSKPKWSVGTYVELLNDRTFSKKGEIGEIFHKDTNDYVYVRFEKGCELQMTTFEWEFRDRNKDVKWHENKPEKKQSSSIEFIKNFEGLKIKNPLVDVPKNNDTIDAMRRSLPEPYSIKTELFNRYGGATAGKEAKVVYDPNDNADKLWNIVPNSNWKIKDFLNCFHQTGLLWSTSAKFKDHRSILTKPEITISKQKKINININKPKI